MNDTIHRFALKLSGLFIGGEEAGSRGGISIIEVLPGPGSPEGDTVVTIRNLREAAAFYDDARRIFRAFLARGREATPVGA